MTKFQIRTVNKLITVESVQAMAWKISNYFDVRWRGLICQFCMLVYIKKVHILETIFGKKDYLISFRQSLNDN